ncbi:hypothetical protein D3C73_1614650 [compost metagenome]
MPTPGSPAAKALEERRAAKGLPPLLGGKKNAAADAAAEAEAAAAAAAEIRAQRVQPQRKNRKKK